jgi:hypothetical protein
VCATEEVPDRLIEVTQRLLLNSLATASQPVEFSASLGQLAALFAVAWRRLSSWAPMRVLLHRQVPDKACVSTMNQELCLLVRSRDQPVAGHEDKLAGGTDKSWIGALLPRQGGVYRRLETQ